MKKQIVILKNQKIEIQKAINKQENLIKTDFESFFRILFDDAIEKNDILKVDLSGFELYRMNHDEQCEREIISLRLDQSYKKEGYNGFYINYYSKMCNTNFDFNRLITIGKIAKTIKQNDDLLKQINNTSEKSRLVISDLYSVRFKVERAIDRLNKSIIEINKQDFIKKLENEGVKFEHEDNYKLPTIEVGRNYYSKIVEMKILKRTEKTATIQIICKNQIWDYKYCKNINTLQTVVRDRVNLAQIVQYRNYETTKQMCN